jgi:predicted NACHT family NTPase
MQARQALAHMGVTQQNLAEKVGLSRSSIAKFFTGKPVDFSVFIEICSELKLNWQEIAALELAEPKQDNSNDIDALVQEVRERIKFSIQERCGTMRVLDMTQPIGLKDIYTNVNILEQITGHRRKGIAELLQECNLEDFERFGLSRITQERVPGLEVVEKYTKLMILGKPGAGKTTFLKYLAIQCNRAEFQAKRVPIFVTLKDFAEAPSKPGLLEFIIQFVGQASRLPLEDSNANAHRRQDACATDIERVLSQGRMLLLLDGLDEVREQDSQRVLKEIRDFSDRFRDNHFVMTCRIAAREYTFEKFTEVEVADFDDEQISTFATKWFKGKAVKAESFIQRLEYNNRTKELATNPLLLTLLCLAFEESGDFPANRSELYQEGLDALLKKWDAKRGIYRDQVYKKLSIQRKEDLLSKIALTTFECGDYFFKQKVAEQYITDYICNLPDANTDEEALQLDSEAVLHSIEAQHGLLVERAKGIYSFSHLTFHEYFTAREIVVVKQSSEEALQNLVRRITNYHWREVFLLAVGMSPSADHLLLLLKEHIDALVAADEKLQHFLLWLSQKSVLVRVSSKPSAVRAFYVALELKLAQALAEELALDRAIDLDLDDALDFALTQALALERLLALDRALALDHALDRAFTLSFARELRKLLQALNNQLPDADSDIEKLKQWWQVSGQIWTEQLRAVMIEHRNIGYDWQFSNEQKEVLKEYYDANLLLVECLNSDCYVSREVRQEIEDTLLLPIAEIENRKHR